MSGPFATFFCPFCQLICIIKQLDKGTQFALKLQHTQRNTELNNLIDKLTEASPRDSCFAQWGSSDES